MESRKRDLEGDLERKTKQIEIEVEQRYKEQFERESKKHREAILQQTEELQQRAYYEVKKKQGFILDELEKDAKQRQEVR